MRARRPEALLYFPAIIIGGMLTLGSLVWVYDKTRKRITHPKLGTLTFYGDHWEAMVPNYRAGKPAVRVAIPGTRKGPGEEELARFDALWARISELVETIRPHALRDLEDNHDSLMGTRDEALTAGIVERVAGNSAALDEDWVLSAVAVHQGRRDRFWALEFGVSWDEEHHRTAYLDGDGQVVGYDASCVVVDL